MSEPAAVTVAVIRQFADLFAQVRKPFIQETSDAWLTRRDTLEDTHLKAHLYGAATFGVKLTKGRGGGRIATNLALEVDFGDRETPVETVLRDILGERGLLVVNAVHDAGRDLDIPPVAWAVSWSGGRSLHFWLTPREPVPVATAYTVAQAIRDGVDQRIASCGLHVCTAWPTSAKGVGNGLRLPWSRHQRTGETGRFIRLHDSGLSLRDPFPADAEYLCDLEAAMVDPDLLAYAATQAADREVVRQPARLSRARLAYPETQLVQGERVERAMPAEAQRIARPCILALLERGVPESLRHDMALLLRAELVHCGFTLEEAWPVYRRYAAACSPAWEEEDARRDLEANWTVTDPALRHLCPGRGEPSSLTEYLHGRCCVGVETCGGRRAEAVLLTWRKHLTVDARVLYAEVSYLEAGYSLRPGDGVHTTAAELMDRCRLGRTRFDKARGELMDAGLLECTATGRPDGAGTPGGGRHSVYRRVIPVPVPV